MAPNALANIKLVIFDVDGVIFDIIDAIRDSIQEGIEKYHLKQSLDDAMPDISRLMELAQSMPIPEIILNANELMDIKIFEGLTVLKRLRIAISIYSKYRARKDSSQLFPGIEDVIKGLSNKGIKLAILSNNKRSYVLEALKKENLEKYFSNILGFNEVSKTKPDPEGLIKLLQLEEVKPEQALFIGDMATDIQAGKNAKIRTIAVASGLTVKEKLQSENPFYLINNIQELKQLFAV
jgi:pyrophosphatase PpaX